MITFPGIYLAKVVSSVDTEKRFRACVRVYGVHSHNVADQDLPWAEYCALTGRMRGDFFPFHTGDDVFVMFLRGDSNSPVIVGGRVSTAQGITDAPIPYQTDVTISDSVEDYKRWDRVDSAGNRVSLSEKAGELHVLLQSGGASVEVTQRSNAIHLRASGAVTVQAPSVVVAAGVADVSAGTVNIDATNGDAVYRSSGGDAILMASPISVTDTSGGDINIGGEVARLRGISLPAVNANTAPAQCGRTNIRSKTINIGAGTGGSLPTPLSLTETQADFDGVAPVLPTTAINIRCIGPVNMHTTGAVDINGATSVNVQSAVSVSVQAPIITLGGSSVINGDMLVNGTILATGKVTALDFATIALPSYLLHTHKSTTPGNQTSVPTTGT